MSVYERKVRDLLEMAGIQDDGPNPWDIEVRNPGFYKRVFWGGSLALGETYMDGWWNCADLAECICRLLLSGAGNRLSFGSLWLEAQASMSNMQRGFRALQVGKEHYDLDVAMYERFLDRRLAYSCAYFKNTDDLDYLDRAQEAKLDLVCRKALLQPGERVLDIGCGWGSFLGYAAERYGVAGVGVTVSREQAGYARERYAGLPLQFLFQPFEALGPGDGIFDKIISIGMFEHVGRKNYWKYFRQARELLREGGVFVLHSIWTNRRSSGKDPWLNKYIFPNGELPSVARVAEAAEDHFVIEDVQNLGGNYDLTLRAWNRRFQTARADMEKRYGERFCRMMEYYFLSCAGAFRSGRIGVGQYVLRPFGRRSAYIAAR